MAKKTSKGTKYEEKETPWYVRTLFCLLIFAFLVCAPFFIYRIGNYIYSDDFFWQSDNRIYLILVIIFLYVILLFTLMIKLPSLIRDKDCKTAATGLKTSIRDMLNCNKIQDSKYYDGTVSPKKMKKYMDEIVESDKRELINEK